VRLGLEQRSPRGSAPVRSDPFLILHSILARAQERFAATLDARAAELLSELRRIETMLDPSASGRAAARNESELDRIARCNAAVIRWLTTR